jgi:hypothetical protein
MEGVILWFRPPYMSPGHVVRHAGIRERSLRKNGGTSNPQDAGSKPAASRAEEPRMRGELPCRHAVDGTDAEPLYPPGSTSEPLLATEIGSGRDDSRRLAKMPSRLCGVRTQLHGEIPWGPVKARPTCQRIYGRGYVLRRSNN